MARALLRNEAYLCGALLQKNALQHTATHCDTHWNIFAEEAYFFGDPSVFITDLHICLIGTFLSKERALPGYPNTAPPPVCVLAVVGALVWR